MRFEGEAPPSLHELAAGDGVTYTSSFSKTVAPGSRVGYFVLPAGDAAAFEDRAASTYISPPFLSQAIVLELVLRGGFEPNLERVRAELRARRDAMLDALAGSFPQDASWSRPEGGYFVWLDLPEATTRPSSRPARPRRAWASSAARTSSRAAPVSGRSSARLAYSYEPPERIREGIARLAGLL